MQEAAFERQCLVPLCQVFGKIAYQRTRVDVTQQAWGFAHRDRARAETLEHETIASKLFSAHDQALDAVLIEFDDLRDQQKLARNAGLVQRSFETLVDQ